jgi:cytochrome c553
MRQLLAFKTGARSSKEGAPMRAVVEKLSVDDMIAVAAYVASRKP